MAKELNKHTPNSDELFKRLESNDTGGLDDFEKEALEGFDSLDDIGSAKKLQAELDRSIDERFFEKKADKGGSSWRYLSIAAGLVLIVGLTVFFMNIMSDKKEMASNEMESSEKVLNEVSQPTDIAPLEEAPKAEGKSTAGDDAKPAEPSEVVSAPGAKGSDKLSQPAREDADKKTDKDETGLNSRMVVKEPKKVEDYNIANAKAADTESDDLKQQTEKNMGPVTASSPVSTEDKKAKGKEEERAEKLVYKENDNRNNKAPESSVAAGGTKDLAKKSESPAKTKSSGEGLANEQKPAVAMDEVQVASNTSSNNTLNTKRDEHNAEFESVSFAKPQDYIKTEINKSEMLKENVKSFKAELTIDEKGKVSAVRFLTKFEGCKGCETEMRKILLNMPGWKANQGKKSVKETISFIYN